MGRTQNLYSVPSSVHLVTGADKLEALARAIENSGFMHQLNAAHIESGKPMGEFLIAVKPNIMTASVCEMDSPVYTDPVLVEHLVSFMRNNGFNNIAVVESRNVYDYSYQGRTVRAVAEMAGYSSDGYRIEDLSDQKVPHDYGGVLGRHSVGLTWRDADFRISFAKNKTHWQCYFTACMKNVYGCLPEPDKMKHYHGRKREFYQCCILMLDAFPVHFGFLDAWVSGDGFSGHVRDAKPNETHTILASQNVLALDWVAGEKMGLNPLRNAVVREAVARWGAVDITRVGDATPWKPWTNVRAPVIRFLDLAEEWYWVSRISSRALASQQDQRFPAVPNWQWLFGPLQALTRFLERVGYRGGH